MTVAADVLHAAIFGKHYHYCPECQRQKPCVQRYCQDEPVKCGDCVFAEGEQTNLDAGHTLRCFDFNCSPDCQAVTQY